MAKPWRRSKSLIKLTSQINAAWPERDTTSDGAIGDAAHASRNSDHNPWVIDRNGQPVVTAQDIDEDLTSDIHSLQSVVDAICRSRDSRVKYLIYEGRITVKGSNLQRWERYTGKNAHKHHLHISVFPDQRLFDDDREWSIGISKSATAAAPTVTDVSAAAPAPAGNAQSVTEDAPANPLAGGEPSSTEQSPTPQQSGVSSQESGDKFNAYVPQIDTAKSWIKRATAGTTAGAILAFLFGLPQWLQIGLFSLLVLIVIGAIVVFVKYHSEIFGYVAKMNTLRATDGAKDPVIVGRPPTD